MTRSTVSRSRRTILLDTSAAVAVCTLDHAAHQAVVATIGDRATGLAGHAWFETFSVLTRLPPPNRRSAADVLLMLRENFPATVFVAEPVQRAFVAELEALAAGTESIRGGAIYDGLVGLAARSAGLALLSCDLSAAATYDRIGAAVEFVRAATPPSEGARR